MMLRATGAGRGGLALAAAADSGASWARSLEWRAAARLPLPAWAAGLLLTVLIVGLYAAVELVAGHLDPGDVVLLGPFTDTHLGYVLSAAVAGYALAAGAAIAAGNAADLDELRLRGAVEGLVEPTLRGGRVAGVGGLLGGLAFMGSVDPPARDLVLLRAWSLDGLLAILSISVAFWLATRAAWFTLAELTAVARAAGSVPALDPLESERLEPLGRMALRAAVLWAGAAALASLSFAITSGSFAELTASAFLVAVAIGSFVIPVRGVHANLRAAKKADLVRVRAEIRRDREAVAALGPEATDAAGRLPGLLAFEARIGAAREWPFDAATVRRFGIVLLLPLISWLGGALVERGVDTLLD
jgi:hypothetical protein